jgi:hypothetical protein
MLAFFDADVPGAVHDHTTHEDLLESAVDRRSHQHRGRARWPATAPSTLSRKPGLQPAWETLMKGVLTGHPSQGLSGRTVIDVERAEGRKFPTARTYANTALT